MIFEQVCKIISEQLDIDLDRITRDSNLIDDLGADSLDLVDLLMSLEDEFEIELQEDDEEIEKFKTVDDIVMYIENCKEV